MVQNRWKSPIVWTGITGLILLILNSFNLLPRLGLTEQTFNVIVESIISVLILIGILNNPTDSKNF
jgi:uncharacterized membrane protein